MPIQTECPDCGKKYRFADDRAGDVVECKECGADVEIPGGRRRSSATAKGKKRKKSDAGIGAGVMIGAGVGGALVIGLIVMFMLGKPAQPPVPPANNGEQVAAAPVAGFTTPPGSSTVPNTPTTPPDPNTSKPTSPTTPVTPAPNPANAQKAASSGFSTPNAAAAPDGFQPTKEWKVQVDPAAEPFKFDVAKNFDIKTVDGYLGEDFVVFPNLPSPFVAVGKNSGPKDEREIWNLYTGEKVATVKGPTISGRTVGLSTDGNLIGWFRHTGTGGGVEVYDIKAKKSLGAVAVDSKLFNVAEVAIPNSKRVVACSNVHRGLVSWKLPSGDVEHEIKLGTNGQPSPHWAFSPGGRFVAVVNDFLSKEINIFDLDSGAKAGSIAFNKSGPSVFGMAFSHDGTELAVAYANSFSENPERFVIWKVADGSIVTDFTVPNEDKRKVNMLDSKGSLQWFPNGKRLLFNGLHIVDREAKSIVYSFDKQSLDFHSLRARHVISDSIVAAWEGTPQKATISPLKLSAEDIAKAQEVTAAGGLMFDAKLPKLTAFDRGSAKDQTAVGNAWSATPDAPTSPATLGDTLPLNSTTGRPRELEFSRLNSAIVGLRFSEGDDSTKDYVRAAVPHSHLIMDEGRSRTRVRLAPVPCQKNWIDLYDVAKKQFVKRVDLPFPCELMAVSPDGQRLLVQAIGGEGRLDVFSADGQPISACRPFQQEPDKAEREVATASFIDNDTVVASSMDDRLVTFKVPSCEPLYSVKDGGAPAVSPNGKWLASCAQSSVEIRNATTGDSAGTIPTNGEVQAMAFAPKGDRLAILTKGKKGNEVLIVDMASGTPTGIPVPQASAPLIWCGENELIIGATSMKSTDPKQAGLAVNLAVMLVDLTKKAVLWTYSYSTADLFTINGKSFDGRLWMAGATGKGNSRQMTAMALPEPAVKKQVGDKKFDSQAVVRPGVSVALSFAVAESPEVKDFGQRARSFVEGSLKENNLTIKDTETLKLVVSVSSPQSLGQMQLQLFSPGKPTQNIGVEGKRVSLRIAYEQSGRTLWESRHEVTNDFFGLQRMDAGASAQSVLDKNMWERVLSLISSNLPPSFVFSPESSRGLGTSNLTGSGPVSTSR